MAKMEIMLQTMDVIRKQAQIYGSNGDTKEDVAAVYELFRAGDVKPNYTVIDFDAIPQGIDDLKHHRVTGRVVAHIAD